MQRSRIMIVEDEDAVAESLRGCLRLAGYEVVGIADNCASARALADLAHPDLALIDIRLKAQDDGIELSRSLRGRNIGCVYMTSHSDEATMTRAAASEPLGYLRKPFGMREMLPVLRAAMCRHAAEVRQHGLEHWLRTTLRSIGDGVVVTDHEALVTFVNPQGESALGRSLKDVLGQPLGDVLFLLQSGTSCRQDCLASRAIAYGGTVCVDPDVEIVRPDGSRLPVDASAAPIREDDGRITGAVIVMHDATARVREERQRLVAERRLQDAERMEGVGMLASSLVDELNRELAAILEGVMSSGGPDAPNTTDPLRAVSVHALRAAELCRRLQSGSAAPPMNLQGIEVTKVLATLLAHERANTHPGIDLAVAPGAEGLFVNADELQLRQVLENVLRNALEALVGRRGTILFQLAAVKLPDESVPNGDTLAGLQPGSYVRIEILDDGPGIPSDVRRRLFEPFFTTKTKATGLGLASANAIVRRHGGAIEVESEPGAGTCLRIYWPSAPRQARQAELPMSAPATAAPVGRVLIVDDDPGVRLVTCRLLTSCGWSCAEAGDGDEALRALGGGLEVDGVVMDLLMPGTPSDEVAQRIRRDHPNLPILLISGIPPSDAQWTAVPRIDFLAKPFAVDDLLLRIGPWPLAK